MHRIRLGQNSASIHWTLLIWLFFLPFQNPIANAQVDDSEPLPPLIAEFRGKAIQSLGKMIAFDYNMPPFSEFFRKSNLDGSPEAYIAARLASSNEPAIWGLAYYSLQRWELAIPCFRQALELDSKQLGVRQRLCIAELLLGRPAIDTHLQFIPDDSLHQFATNALEWLHLGQLDFEARSLAVEQFIKFGEERLEQAPHRLQFLVNAVGLLTRQVPLSACDMHQNQYQGTPFRIRSDAPWYVNVESYRDRERVYFLPPLHAPQYREPTIPLADWPTPEFERVWWEASVRRWELFDRLCKVLMQVPGSSAWAFSTWRAAREGIWNAPASDDIAYAEKALLNTPQLRSFPHSGHRVQPQILVQYFTPYTESNTHAENSRIPIESFESERFVWTPAHFILHHLLQQSLDKQRVAIQRLTGLLMEQKLYTESRLMIELYGLYRVEEEQYLSQCEAFLKRMRSQNFPDYHYSIGCNLAVEVHHTRGLNIDLLPLLLKEPGSEHEAGRENESGSEAMASILAYHCVGLGKRGMIKHAAQVAGVYNQWLIDNVDFQAKRSGQGRDQYQRNAQRNRELFTNILLIYDQLLPVARMGAIADPKLASIYAQALEHAVANEQNSEFQLQLLAGCGCLESLAEINIANTYGAQSPWIQQNIAIRQTILGLVCSCVHHSKRFPRKELLDHFAKIPELNFGQLLFKLIASEKVGPLTICQLVEQHHLEWQNLPLQRQQALAVVLTELLDMNAIRNNASRGPATELSPSLHSIHEELRRLATSAAEKTIPN